MPEKNDNINNEKEKLPFAKNEVYRLMRENLDSDKMIKDREFLSRIKNAAIDLFRAVFNVFCTRRGRRTVIRRFFS